jgi:hypothetical protein
VEEDRFVLHVNRRVGKEIDVAWFSRVIRVLFDFLRQIRFDTENGDDPMRMQIHRQEKEVVVRG